MPAEWERHERLWIGFPWDSREWPSGLNEAQREIAAFANAIHDDGRGEKVYLIAGDETSLKCAEAMADKGIVVQQRKIGDIWLRDTGCISVTDGTQRRAQNFRFNGWGGKYLMDGDQHIGRILAEEAGLQVADCDWILEGGAIDVDGNGLAVATQQCLLNPDRNPEMTQADLESALRRDLGVENLLWLGNGLIGDHTDGHVDNLARFVAPGHLLLPVASSDDDPNAGIYADAMTRANEFSANTRMKISTLPSPGRVLTNGEITPASYMNFCIGNRAVIIPAFGVPQDEAARQTLAAYFPDRKTISLPSNTLLHGGGSFHCCSQQVTVASRAV